MNRTGYEQRKLKEIAAEYKARGYEVFVRPRPEQLPGFLTGFHPDLIAHGSKDSVVVQMKVGTQTAASEHFRELAETIRSRPGWRFSLVVVDPHTDEVAPSTQQLVDGTEIRHRITQAGKLQAAGAIDAAFLLMWTSIEALLRHSATREGLPLERIPSSSLIKELFSQGVLSRSAFDTIQRSYSIRNALTHGFVADNLEENFSALTTVANGLLEDLEEEEGS